jgi:hypothetical protein
VAEYAPRMIGLTLAEGKQMLAAVQRHLVQAQTEEHWRRRRRCQRCGVQRFLKVQRLPFGFAVRYGGGSRAALTPCRCAVTCRRTLSSVAEIMPARCTHEYERVVAKMDALLPRPPGRDAAVGVSASRYAAERGNHPAAYPSCGR